MLTPGLQIEKFIESIFPSQKAEDAQRRVTGEVSKAEAEQKKQEAESRQDIYFMLSLMLAIVLFVAGIMVLMPPPLNSSFLFCPLT